MPLLSIVVPVYNVEKYMEKCIDSILKQKIHDFEIILIDDGSNDKTGDICDAYANKDERIKVIHQINKGVSAARNAGIRIASGKYLGFIDGDDWIEQDMYAVLVECMESNPSIDICIGGLRKDYADGSSKEIFKQEQERVMKNTEAIEIMLAQELFRWELCDKLYKRTLFNGFFCNETIFCGEDLLANCELFYRAKYVFYKPLYKYHYYTREDSSTQKVDTDQKKTMVDVFIQIMENDYFFTELAKERIMSLFMKNIIYQIKEMFFNYEGKKICKEKVGFYQEIVRKYYRYLNSKLNLSVLDKSFLDHIVLTYEKCSEFFQDKYEKVCECIENASKSHSYIYIYGTGVAAKHIAEVFKKKNLEYVGFIVTDGQGSIVSLMRHPVIFLSQLKIDNRNNGIVLGLNETNAKDVTAFLKKNGHNNIYYPEFW